MAAAVLGTACGDDNTATDDTNDDVVAAAKAALETRNGWDQGSAQTTLDGVEDGRFARGGVTDPAGGGALWFASLEDSDWQIVWDGNGIVDCATLESFGDCPASLLPQCAEDNGDRRER